MFKAPFSFKGRIRRTEYALSLLIYLVVVLVLSGMLVFSAVGSVEFSGGSIALFYLVLLPFLFFLWAQGAKRCHDRGNSGWYQLIPFYGLWMLFADSEPGYNEYGPNPKGIGNHDQFQFEHNHQRQ